MESNISFTVDEIIHILNVMEWSRAEGGYDPEEGAEVYYGRQDRLISKLTVLLKEF